MSEEPELKIEVGVNVEEEVNQEKQVNEEVCVNDLVVEPLAKRVAESVVDLVDVSGAVFVEEFEAKVAVEVCVDVFEVVQEEVLVAAMVEYPDAKEVIQMVVQLVEEVAVGVPVNVLVVTLMDEIEAEEMAVVVIGSLEEGVLEKVAVGVCAIVLAAALVDETEKVVVEELVEGEEEVVEESVEGEE
jgi:hypothetical protein